MDTLFMHSLPDPEDLAFFRPAAVLPASFNACVVSPARDFFEDVVEALVVWMMRQPKE